MSVGGSAGHSGLWALDIAEGPWHLDQSRTWYVTLATGSEAREDAVERREQVKRQEADNRLERDKQRICDALVRFPAGETKALVRDASGLHTRRFDPALASLLADGDVVSCEVSKSNRQTPYPGYRLVEVNGNHP